MKKKKKAKKLVLPSDKELNVLGKLWSKYGTIAVMDYLIFLERNMAMEHGATHAHDHA